MARVTLQQYCDEARRLIDSGAYDQVLAICRHILKRYPKHIETYRLLGEACLEKGELEEATDVFKRLLSADPENFVAYAGLGVVCEKKGALTEAVWYMERAFELAPNNDDIRDALRRLYSKRDGTEPPRIKLNKAALARMYARGSQHRQAIDEFQSLLEFDPDRMDIRIALAETLWQDGRREQAAQIAQEILKTAPECLKAILLLGIVQTERGRSKEAQAILARARSLDPENRLARAFFAEQSPLPVQSVKIPRIKEEPEAETQASESTDIPPVEEEAEPLATATQREAVSEKTTLTSAEAVPAEIEAPEFATTPHVEERADSIPAAETEAASEEAAVPPSDEGGISDEETLASVEAIASSSLPDIERNRLLLERRPKDNSIRLALARAYRDQEQMKLALEQYGMLMRAKSSLLAEAIGDMEGIVASRPDNLEAHELLADLYAKNGQLPQAVDRLRWIQQRLEQKHP